MRISELSERSGVSVATIKYYLREGLLPAGEASGPNRSAYSPAHLERLVLIRALIDLARAPIAAIRRLTEVLDQPEPDPRQLFAVAQELVTQAGDREPSERSRERILRALGPDLLPAEYRGPELEAARSLDVYEALGIDPGDQWLASYARAAREVAVADLDELQRQATLTDQARIAAVGTAMGDVVLASMRRRAQAAETARRYGGPMTTNVPAPAADAPHRTEESR